MSRNPVAVGLFVAVLAATSCSGGDAADSTATTGIGAGSTTSTAGSSTTAVSTSAATTTTVTASTTSVAATTTTVGELATTTTADASATSTVAAVPTTTSTAADTTVPVTDASRTGWIVGPQEGDPESVGPGTDCDQFFDAMGAGTLTVAECGDWNAVGGRRVWTVSKGSSGLFFGVVWQETESGTWIPLLRILEESPGSWESLTIKTVDIDGGPNDELVSGARFAGTGGYLDIDVADIRDDLPLIVASVTDLVSATAYTDEDTGVWMWVPEFADDDPLCCPSSTSQFLLSSTSGTWNVTWGLQNVAIDDVPRPSEF